ncbi:MAG: arylamine N-acetyltransferase [Acidobacteriaceae bacterium]|nr:arylamine N-acetyltransferase [Acidobacteriaceae bacterium]
MNIGTYLARIGYRGPLIPSAETLRALHLAHLQSVPFENLDISRGRKIALDENAFVWKIVQERRGGFCYELNGAFAALLRSLGFRVTLLSARVPGTDGSNGFEYDHLTLRVDLDEPWLADVGFGDSFLQPLLLKIGLEQKQADRTYRIVETGERLALERLQPDGKWKLEYDFTLQPRELNEFAGMCHYHQTSPESHFTRERVCTRATPDGRITVADSKLIITRNGAREEMPISSESEWNRALQEHFGIVL